MTSSNHVDVIVLGGGQAGLTAAISAADNGLYSRRCTPSTAGWIYPAHQKPTPNARISTGPMEGFICRWFAVVKPRPALTSDDIGQLTDNIDHPSIPPVSGAGLARWL